MIGQCQKKNSLKNISKLNQLFLGLCGFDLWHLVFLYGSGHKVNTMADYKRIFKAEFDSVKERVKKIYSNPLYNSIIDTRCSRENTGIHSKIPIYKKGDWKKYVNND